MDEWVTQVRKAVRLSIGVFLVSLCMLSPFGAFQSHPRADMDGVAVAVELPEPLVLPPAASELFQGVGDAFVENLGQLADSRVRYFTQGGSVSIGLTDDGIIVVIRDPSVDGREDAAPGSGEAAASTTDFAVMFDGCHAVVPRGRDAVDRTTSYFIGNDPSLWVRGARSFREVVYEGLWDGVDLVLRLKGDVLKYDILLDAGADPRVVALRYDGVLGLSLDASGDLIIRTDAGMLRDGRPVVFQEGALPDAGAEGRFTVLEDQRVGFGLPDGCAPGRPILIDPGLVFSTFLGGSGGDTVHGPTLDGAGNILVCGATYSPDFPTTNGSYDPAGKAGYSCDGLVARFDPEGCLLNSTYIGGSSFDELLDIIVLQDGDVCLVGITLSVDFPVTADALSRELLGDDDGVILKMSGDLSDLTYGSYLGGASEDLLINIDLDPSGIVCVSGVTCSPDIPTTPGAFCATYEGPGYFLDTIIVYQLDGDLSQVLYCTYVNGADFAVPLYWAGDPPIIILGQSVDSNGDILLAGRTQSTTLPTTPGAFQSTFSGGSLDAFALKLRPKGAGASDLIACTYLGGSSAEEALSILAMEDGRVAVVGNTESADLPMERALDNVVEWMDGFLMVLDGNLTTLEYGTFLGGGGTDILAAVVEARGGGLLYLMGSSSSSDVVGSKGSFDSLFNSVVDYYIASIDIERSCIEYYTWIGGHSIETVDIHGDVDVLAITEDGGLIAVGRTESSDFPITAGAFQEHFGGGTRDGFVLRLDPAPCGLPDPPRNLSATPGNGTVSLRWDPHTNIGYSVQSYRVYRGTAPGSWDLERNLAGTSTGLNDGGLTNGVRYYYRVSAVNSMGEGPMALANATPPAPPSAPGHLGLGTGDGNVTVNWSVPSDPGGDLFGYRLLRGPSLEALGLILETDTSTFAYLDWNVTRGEEYVYAVLAFNGAGNGTMAWKSIIPSRPPSPPISLDLVPHDGWVRVTWNVPRDKGGLPLKGYRVYIREEGTDDARVVEVDFTHLLYDDHRVENGRRYFYYVIALAGDYYKSPPTVELSEVPFGPPTAPAGLVVMPGDSQVFLEWNASDSNGRRITNYTIRWGTAPGELLQTIEIGNKTGHTMVGAQNGVMYYFQVAARNLAGLGTWSPEAHATPLGVPSEVLNLNANMTMEGVLITWDAPDGWGGSEELSYRLSRAGPGGTIVVLGEAMTERTLFDGTVLAGETYKFRVCASNALNTGPSVEVEVFVVKPPTAVRDLVASLGDGAITLSWAPPENDGSNNITVYLVYRQGPTGGYSRLDRTVLMSFTDTDVEAGTEYWYYVTAKNDRFEGTDWTAVNATAITHPGPVVDLRAVYSDGAVELEWSSPVAQWAATPTGYRVLRGTTLADLAVVATLGLNLTYRDGTVERDRMYYYQVIATSGVGDGEPGQVKEVQAGEAEPPRSMMWLAVLSAVVIAVLLAMVIVFGRRARAAAGAPTVHIVEEVLVVLRDGRLIATSGREESRSRDPQVMTGMLTAIQGFAKDGLERGGALESIKYEDNTILMASGVRLYVAVVVFGQPDEALQEVLEETVRQLEATYGDIIDGWDGDLSVFAGVSEAVRPLVERTRHVTREDVQAMGAAPGETEGSS